MSCITPAPPASLNPPEPTGMGVPQVVPGRTGKSAGNGEAMGRAGLALGARWGIMVRRLRCGVGYGMGYGMGWAMCWDGTQSGIQDGMGWDEYRVGYGME